MTQLVERRWTRYGHDRIYVTTSDGVDCGHVDLKNRRTVPRSPELDAVLQHCLTRWCSDEPPPTPSEPDSPSSEESVIAGAWPAPPIEADPSTTGPLRAPSTHAGGKAASAPAVVAQDLVDNVAGAAARAKRDEVNAQAPVLNVIARLFGVKTNERAWRVGAQGEVKVGRELTKLDQGWHWIHAVPVGDNGSDIDHVLIGPAGVFTLNAKRHPAGRAWIGERAIMINGHRTDYLRNARFEAARARKLLSSACGFPVAVEPAIVFVDLNEITIKQMPTDVHVVTRKQLAKWLRSRPPRLDTPTVDAIFAQARTSTTWQSPPR